MRILPRAIRPARRAPREPGPEQDPPPEPKEPKVANKHGRGGRPDPDRPGHVFPGGRKHWPSAW